jgi:uncharacterized C2H2 Zn-finger protein
LDTGFRDHLARKTVRIDYICHNCKSNLQFFNRCQLIQHIQSHGLEPALDCILGVTTTIPLAIDETEFYMSYKKSDSSDIFTNSVISNSCVEHDNKQPVREALCDNNPGRHLKLEPSTEEIEFESQNRKPSLSDSTSTSTMTSPHKNDSTSSEKPLKPTDYESKDIPVLNLSTLDAESTDWRPSETLASDEMDSLPCLADSIITSSDEIDCTPQKNNVSGSSSVTPANSDGMDCPPQKNNVSDSSSVSSYSGCTSHSVKAIETSSPPVVGFQELQVSLTSDLMKSDEDEDDGLTVEECEASKEFLKGLEQCQFCDKLLLSSIFKRHEIQCSSRATDLKPGYCLACKSDFSNPISLAVHGVEHLKDILICLYCNNRILRVASTSEVDRLKVLKNHIYHCHGLKVKYPYSCSLCEVVCEDRKTVESHMVQHHKDSIPIAKDCKVLVENSKVTINRSLSENDDTRATIDVSYCPACKGKEFNKRSLLIRHMKKEHKLTLRSADLNRLKLRKVSSAKRYTTLISSKQISASPPVPQSEDGFLDVHLMNTSSSPTQQYSRPFEFPIRKRKKLRKYESSELSLESSRTESNRRDSGAIIMGEPSSEEPIPIVSKARLEDGTLHCLKCKEYTTSNEDEFYSHIKSSHVWSRYEIERRSLYGGAEKSDFWCPECDVTFVTKLALTRHIRVSHEFLRNVFGYLEKIGYEGESPLLENQCEVCYVQFEDAMELSKHMRTHGLAFLRLQQKRKVQFENSL